MVSVIKLISFELCCNKHCRATEQVYKYFPNAFFFLIFTKYYLKPLLGPLNCRVCISVLNKTFYDYRILCLNVIVKTTERFTLQPLEIIFWKRCTGGFWVAMMNFLIVLLLRHRFARTEGTWSQTLTITILIIEKRHTVVTSEALNDVLFQDVCTPAWCRISLPGAIAL